MSAPLILGHCFDRLAGCNSSSNAIQTENQSVSRENCTSQETACSIDKRLQDIQKAVADTQNVILSQNNAVHCILQSVSCSHERQSNISANALALPKHKPWTPPSVSLRVLPGGSRYGGIQSQSHAAGEVFPDHNDPSEQREPPEPQTLFEMSANFYPEVYTTDQRLPPSCLVVISSFEEHLVQDSKRNLYRLFYQKSPRQWCRIDLSIKIPRRSKYWAASKTTQNEYKTMETKPGYAPLPYSLISQIQPVLLSLTSVEQVRASLSTTTRLW